MNLSRKTFLLISWLVWFSPAFCMASMTSEEQGDKRDSISYYLSHHQYKHYFQLIGFLFYQDVREAQKSNGISQAEKNQLVKLAAPLLERYPGLNATDQFQQRYSLMIVGVRCVREMNDFNLALKYLNRSHDLAVDPYSLDTLAWYVENTIVNIYTRVGDYENALRYSVMVENALKKNNQLNYLSRFYVNVGLIYQSSGKKKEAFRCYEQGLTLSTQLKYNIGRCANLISLAHLEIGNGNYNNANKILADAEKIIPDIIATDRIVQDRISEINRAYGDMLFHQDSFRQSIQYYTKAINALTINHASQLGRDFGKLYAQIARVYFRLDSIVPAKEAVMKGLKSLSPAYKNPALLSDTSLIYRENTFTALFTVLAQISYKESQGPDSSFDALQRALRFYDLAMAANNEILRNVLADPSKLLAIQENRDLTASGIEIIYLLYEKSGKKAEWISKAREYFSRSKSILYEEKIRENVLASLMNEKDKEALQELDRKIFNLNQDRLDRENENVKLNAEITGLQDSIETLIGRYIHLSDIILPKAYIEYAISHDYIYAIGEINHQQYFARLGSTSELNPLLMEMNTYLLSKGVEGSDVILEKLYSFLVKPVLPELAGQITIIPDGKISFVPFDALRNEDGKYVIEETTIAYAFRYGDYYSEIQTDPKGKKIFCLAPQYPEDPSGRTDQRGSLYQLRYAQEEIDGIKALFGQQVEVVTGGNKMSWLEEIKETSIFHFCGHAIVNKDRAFLALNGENLQLTEEEIQNLHNPMDMVVLSACETGLGKLEYGEGVRSLGKCFLESGARAAIFSLWTVNDRSTSRIMEVFYEQLKKGATKAEALRNAKLDFISHANPADLNPYFWAGFVAAGDMNKLDLTNHDTWKIMGGIVMICLFVVLISKRKKLYLKT